MSIREETRCTFILTLLWRVQGDLRMTLPRDMQVRYTAGTSNGAYIAHVSDRKGSSVLTMFSQEEPDASIEVKGCMGVVGTPFLETCFVLHVHD